MSGSIFLDRFLLPMLASVAAAAVTAWWKKEQKGPGPKIIIPLAAILAFLIAMAGEKLANGPSLSPGVGGENRGEYLGERAGTAGSQATAHKTSTQNAPLFPSDVEFVSRHIAPGQHYKDGAWDVVVISQQPQSSIRLRTAYGNVLRDKGYSFLPLFDSSAFKDAEMFERLCAANPSVLKVVAQYRDGLIVGQVELKTTADQSLGLLTTHISLRTCVVSARNGTVIANVTSQQSGAGFDEQESITAAEDRVAKDIARELSAKLPNK